MINSIEELRKILQGTNLENHHLTKIDLPETTGVLAIAIDNNEALGAWEILRQKLTLTERWPILVINDHDLFSSFPFTIEVNKQGYEYSVRDLINKANILDLETELQNLARREFDDNWQDEIEISWSDLQAKWGITPDLEEITKLIENKEIYDHYSLEKWLFNWEIERFSQPAKENKDASYLDWYQPKYETISLLLMPTSNSWEIPAYIHWYGAEMCTTELLIALLKKWGEMYEAELVAHYGTMLQIITKQKPTTPEAAFRLAWSQELIAPCTTILPGISLRDHAKELLGTNKWFLHERP